MTIQLAGHQHEKQLRDLLRDAPMPGWVRLAFGREPDFFHGIGVQGKSNQVLISLEQDRVTAMACRSVKPLLVNGLPLDFGYLGGLRLHPNVRRTSLLARGYTALAKLHQAQPVPAYLTTIVEDNREARRLLTSGRAGLPHYLDRGRLITFAVNLNRRRPRYRSPVEIRRGDAASLDTIVRFLGREGRRRQFSPAIVTADFGSDYLRGLRPEDFRVALDAHGEIAGVAAAWDQGAFKQTIVQGYATPAGLLRPALSGALRLAGFRGLPAPGQSLHSLYIAFPCVRGDDPVIMRALLERIYADHLGGTHHFLLLAFHEQDPLAVVSRHFLTFRYVSRLYIVCWDDGLDFVNALDPALIPHLELATL